MAVPHPQLLLTVLIVQLSSTNLSRTTSTTSTEKKEVSVIEINSNLIKAMLCCFAVVDGTAQAKAGRRSGSKSS